MIVWTASLAKQTPSAMKGIGMAQRAQLLKKSVWPLNLTCDKDPSVTHKKVGLHAYRVDVFMLKNVAC